MNSADTINNNAELKRAKAILEIAAEAYAYMETQGRVRPDENVEMWIAEGSGYNIAYNPSNENFFVEGRHGNEMVAQNVEGQLDFMCVHSVTEADLENFQKIRDVLASKQFPCNQSLKQTQAKAESRWDADNSAPFWLSDRGREINGIGN